MKLTAYNYRNRALWVCLVCMFSFLDPVTRSHAIDAKTSLYLPINSALYPTLKTDLETALADAKLGHIEVKTADYWLGYQQGLRLGRVGVYFAAPHYSAWAIQSHNFVPLLRLPTSLKYVIAARKDDSHFFEVNDLAQQQVCTHRGLNLNYILLTNVFKKGLFSAKPLEVWSVADEMKKDTADCKAFSVSDHLFEELNIKYPNKFTRLYQGNTFNNYAFLAHPEIDPEIRHRLERFLKSPRAIKLLEKIYRMYSSKINLVSARKSDYPTAYIEPLSDYWKLNTANKL